MRNDTPEREPLFVAVETFHAVGLHGEPILVERGSAWRGGLPKKYSQHFVPSDSDEGEIQRARARFREYG